MAACAKMRWSLPCDSRSAGVARQHVSEVCAGYERDLREVAVLLASELVANAVEHSHGEVELVVGEEGARLRVEVHDASPEQPRLRSLDRGSARGRGLLLVQELAADWGAEPTDRGKCVWFTLPRAARGRPE